MSEAVDEMVISPQMGQHCGTPKSSSSTALWRCLCSRRALVRTPAGARTQMVLSVTLDTTAGSREGGKQSNSVYQGLSSPSCAREFCQKTPNPSQNSFCVILGEISAEKVILLRRTLPHPKSHVQAAHCRATPCSAQQQGAEVAATGYRRALPHAARLLRAPPCRVRVAAGFPRCGCSLPGAPKKHRKQVITGDSAPAEDAQLTSDGRRHPASARGRLSCASRTGVVIDANRKPGGAGAAALPAAPRGPCRRQPTGRSRTRPGFCVRRTAVCAWRLGSPAAVARSQALQRNTENR